MQTKLKVSKNMITDLVKFNQTGKISSELSNSLAFSSILPENIPSMLLSEELSDDEFYQLNLQLMLSQTLPAQTYFDALKKFKTSDSFFPLESNPKSDINKSFLSSLVYYAFQTKEARSCPIATDFCKIFEKNNNITRKFFVDANLVKEAEIFLIDLFEKCPNVNIDFVRFQFERDFFKEFGMFWIKKDNKNFPLYLFDSVINQRNNLNFIFIEMLLMIKKYPEIIWLDFGIPNAIKTLRSELNRVNINPSNP